MVLVPSILGVRPGVTLLAARLRGAGHRVFVLDPLQRTFDDLDEARAAVAAFGGEVALQRHADAAVAALPDGFVVVGWARGAATAEHLACTRAVAGAVLVSGALPLAELGLLDWPAGVPAQVHTATGGTGRGPREVEGFVDDVRAAGGSVEVLQYAVASPLFDDPGLPGAHDGVAAEQLRDRVSGFCSTYAR